MLPSPTNKKDETESLGDSDHHPRKRQRVRLSCLECRRRKLSCDRGFPCERCVKSGTPDLCTYEGKTAPTPLNVKSGIPAGAFSTSSAAQNLDRRGSLSAGTLNVSGDASNVTAGLYRRELESAAAREQQRDHDRIRKLELEVATLKNLLSSTVTAAASAGRGILSTDGSTVVADNSPADQRRDAELPAAGDDVVIPQTPPPYAQDGEHQQECHAVDKDELRFFKGKEFKTRYFGPHNACMAFQEVSRYSQSVPLRGLVC